MVNVKSEQIHEAGLRRCKKLAGEISDLRFYRTEDEYIRSLLGWHFAGQLESAIRCLDACIQDLQKVAIPDYNVAAAYSRMSYYRKMLTEDIS